MKPFNFFLFLWVIFAVLDPDPESGSGYGSTHLIESGSNMDPDPESETLSKKIMKMWEKQTSFGVTKPYLGFLSRTDHPRGRAEPEPDWRQNSERSSAWGEAAAAVPPAMASRRRGMRAGGGGTGGGCVHSDGAYWFLQDQWKIFTSELLLLH